MKINHPTDRAAASTVEALMMGLRERGTAALAQGTEAEVIAASVRSRTAMRATTQTARD
jgi:hypothetical protein